MGFAIPKLQYKNTDTFGDTTIGSSDLTSVGDTSLIVAGMFARGANIPDGALVGSVAGNTVTLAGGVQASANGLATSLSFGFEINFDYPPKETLGESLEPNSTISSSLSGIRQISTNYVEGIRKPTFSFISPALYILLEQFLRTWAIFGKEFRYFEDKTVNVYLTYELDTLKTSPKKLFSRGVDQYVWEVPLAFRRIL